MNIQVAAELFEQKQNIEFSFPSRPSYAQLKRVVEHTYQYEADQLRPIEVPLYRFEVSKFKVWDEVKNKWVDLTTADLLESDCQVYAFQHEGPYYKESTGEIPPARKPRKDPYPELNSGYAPRPAAAAATALTVRPSQPRALREPTFDEKVRTVFEELDINNRQVIQDTELFNGFTNLGVDFSRQTIQSLFEKADTNKDLRVSYAEWERFVNKYPIMLECLYHRVMQTPRNSNVWRRLKPARMT